MWRFLPVRVTTIYVLVVLAVWVGLVEPLGCVAHCQDISAAHLSTPGAIYAAEGFAASHGARPTLNAAGDQHGGATRFLCDFRISLSAPSQAPADGEHVHVHEHTALVLVLVAVAAAMQIQLTVVTPRLSRLRPSTPPLLPPPIRMAYRSI